MFTDHSNFIEPLINGDQTQTTTFIVYHILFLVTTSASYWILVKNLYIAHNEKMSCSASLKPYEAVLKNNTF